MIIVGKTDDSAEVLKEYYTVEIVNGTFIDVMVVWKEDRTAIDYAYIMQLEDGGTVYTHNSKGESVGDIEDYGISEKEATEFVINNLREVQEHG